MKQIIAIAAMDEGRVIGAAGALPWHCSDDMQHFKRLTDGHAVLMGRKTWDSLPPKMRPLPRRKNIVVSSHPETVGPPEEVHCVRRIEDAIAWFRESDTDVLWIIGGEQLYRQCLAFCDGVELTLIEGRHEGDAFFPAFEEEFTLEREEAGQGCRFLTYRRRGASTRPVSE